MDAGEEGRWGIEYEEIAVDELSDGVWGEGAMWRFGVSIGCLYVVALGGCWGQECDERRRNRGVDLPMWASFEYKHPPSDPSFRVDDNFMSFQHQINSRWSGRGGCNEGPLLQFVQVLGCDSALA